ncbi:MAG: hypothetical protein IJ594_03960 [Oscillospiraceae bacterium]|nr:hypothetical protein [Oscillospiraceae bacterium]
MTDSHTLQTAGLTAWLRGLFAWIVCTAVGLILAASLVAKGAVGHSTVGYVSSALSFAAAICAGAASKSAGGGLGRALLRALATVVVLLTIGSLLSRGALTSAGILSVVTFTIAGYLVGSVLPLRGRRPKRRALIPGKRK